MAAAYTIHLPSDIKKVETVYTYGCQSSGALTPPQILVYLLYLARGEAQTAGFQLSCFCTSISFYISTYYQLPVLPHPLTQ